MVKQRDAFLESEGNAFYSRNKADALSSISRSGSDEPVLRAMEFTGVSPRSTLEIGCANGWRLSLVAARYGSAVAGIDPSADALADGRRSMPHADLRHGTADELPFADHQFDTVIFGFCLYLCDPQDLFRIAAEADRVLADKGYLIIHDFHPDVPHAREYAHLRPLRSHKMDYGTMFSWHPAYQLIAVFPFASDYRMPPTCADTREATRVFYKDIAAAFPSRG